MLTALSDQGSAEPHRSIIFFVCSAKQSCMIIELDSESLTNRSKVQLWDIPDRIGTNIYERVRLCHSANSEARFPDFAGGQKIIKLVGFSITAPRRHPRQLDSAEFLQLSS